MHWCPEVRQFRYLLGGIKHEPTVLLSDYSTDDAPFSKAQIE